MMISEELYLEIEQKYGQVASWAIWMPATAKPKSNISDLSIFDISSNPKLLDTIHTDVVMVALNFAREVAFEKPFMNFHDANPYGQDFKIRFAFEGTYYYGAYMTDIIKDFPMLSSKDVLKYLSNNPQQIHSQIEAFREELRFIQSNSPTILAFGTDTFNILNKFLNKNEYNKLIQLTHYSHQISKENYRLDTYKRLGIKN